MGNKNALFPKYSLILAGIPGILQTTGRFFADFPEWNAHGQELVNRLIGSLNSTRRNNAAGIPVVCVHHIDWNLQRTPLVSNPRLCRALNLPTGTANQQTGLIWFHSLIPSDFVRLDFPDNFNNSWTRSDSAQSRKDISRSVWTSWTGFIFNSHDG